MWQYPTELQIQPPVLLWMSTKRGLMDTTSSEQLEQTSAGTLASKQPPGSFWCYDVVATYFVIPGYSQNILSAPRTCTAAGITVACMVHMPALLHVTLYVHRSIICAGCSCCLLIQVARQGMMWPQAAAVTHLCTPVQVPEQGGSEGLACAASGRAIQQHSCQQRADQAVDQ